MKNKLILVSAMLAAFTGVNAAISLTENIALEGFVDMSYLHWDAEESSGDYKWKESDNSFNLDQAEIDFLFDFSPVTAQIDIQYVGGVMADEIELEQAFASYNMENGGAVTGGRYVSFLGLEAVEPTGLYQYSLAYASAESGDMSWIPGYNNGVKYTVETDTGFFGISLQDGVWTRDNRLGGDPSMSIGSLVSILGSLDDLDLASLLGDMELPEDITIGDLIEELEQSDIQVSDLLSGLESMAVSNWGAEIAAAWTGEEGLTLFLGGAYEEYEIGDVSFDKWLINTYVAYEVDSVTFGAEFNYGENEDIDHMSALIMANFAYSEQASVTGRISYMEEDYGDYDWDAMKFTAAHNYAFTDNLALVAEISYIDGCEDWEELSGALELLFSF